MAEDVTQQVPPQAPLASLREGFSKLSNNQKIGLMLGVALVVAMVVGLLLWVQTPGYRILFTNLSDRDGGAITAALQQMNVPYRLESAGTITVPSDQVYDIRLKLATQGLPKGGTVGYELMDTQKFGISQFSEQINYQRSLEGELARSIQSLSSVENARVHLAIPKTTVFLRENEKPRASVVLNLYAGRMLDAGQISGIVHLVSSSVPDLPVQNVSVVDQSGNLLTTSNQDGSNNLGLDAKQLGYVRQIESLLSKRIETILTPILGEDNVKAEVTASLDFARVEETSERFKPNQKPETAAVRSSQTVETLQNGAQSASGVPGALSNQPPGAASAPISGTAAGTNRNAPNVPTVPPQHREATVNYEVDKTIQHVIGPVGSIKRLSVAVVVNYKKKVGKDGKASAQPLTAPEMEQVNNLVKQAMGYSQDRGDSVNVVNAAFAHVDDVPQDVAAQAKQFALDNWRELAKYAFVLVVMLYLLFGVIRPIIRHLTGAEKARLEAELAAKEKAEEEGEGTEQDEEGAALGESPDANVILDPEVRRYAEHEELLRAVKEIAKEDPRTVANIVRTWINKNE